jgi:hypothetical protein
MQSEKLKQSKNKDIGLVEKLPSSGTNRLKLVFSTA